jgi:ribosomal protein S27AE
MVINMNTHLVFSLGWYCGHCDMQNPVLTATHDNWLICPKCGTKYDLKMAQLAPNQRVMVKQLEDAGIPYIGAAVK